MKKSLVTFTVIAFGAMLLITNCAKKEETPTPTTIDANTTTPGTNTGFVNKWTIDDKTFTQISGSSPVWNGSGKNNGFMGSGSSDSTVAFQVWLYSQNPATGNYKIMSYLTKLGSADSTVASINVGLGSKAWWSKNNGGVVNVTNTNGVISVSVANIECTSSMLGTGDVVTVSGNLTK